MKNKILYISIICVAVILCVTACFFIYKGSTSEKSLVHFKCPENYAENDAGTAEYEKAMLTIKTDQVKIQGQIQLANVNAQNDKELEILRAERDKQNNDMKLQITSIKDRLEHTEEMHKILMPHMVEAAKGEASGYTHTPSAS